MPNLDPRLIIEYDAPVKEDGSATLTPVGLDWPRRWRELYGTDARDVLEEMRRASSHPYYGTTIDFVQHSLDNENWYLRPEEEMGKARLKMGPKLYASCRAMKMKNPEESRLPLRERC